MRDGTYFALEESGAAVAALRLSSRKTTPMSRWFTKFSTKVAELTGHYVAFVIALGIILIWAITGPFFGFSNTWQLVINTGTTIVTFLMVFLIQHTQNRDSLAMQLKLDELIRSVETADNAIIDAEEESDETLHVLKQKYQSLCKEHEALRDQLEKIQGPVGAGNVAGKVQ
jgi:low affinity Fe/Cu permease